MQQNAQTLLARSCHPALMLFWRAPAQHNRINNFKM
jgi:hypothetical protein